MGRPVLMDEQPNFAGGLNTISDESALGQNQMRRSENARLTDYGAVTKRGGTQRTKTAVLTAHAVQNGYGWFKDAGTTQLLAVANGTLYTATPSSLPYTWATQAGALSASATPDFDQFTDGSFADVVYIADGGLLNKWDGTTLTVNIASTPAVTSISAHNQRLWGVTGADTSVYYSDLNNGDTLGIAASDGGQIIVRTFGNQRTTAVASCNESLLVFHETGISRITGYGQSDIDAKPAGITSSIGTISPQSVVSDRTRVFFVSERGLCVATESDVQYVGTPESPDPLLGILPYMSTSDIQKIACVLHRPKKEVWVWVPSSGVFVYNLALGAWSGPFTGAFLDDNTVSLWEGKNVNGEYVTLRGTATGWVELCDTGTSDAASSGGVAGSPIVMTVRCRRLYFGDNSLAKAFRWSYVLAELKGSTSCRMQYDSGLSSGSASLPPSLDSTWGASGTTWGTGTWGGTGSQDYRNPMAGTGYYADVSIVDDGYAVPVFAKVKVQGFALGRR